MKEERTECPHCGESLVGDPIPVEKLSFYNAIDHDMTKPYPNTHFIRTIGIVLRGKYDGVLYRQCPDCGGKWHRFPKGDYRRDIANRWVDGLEAADARPAK
jgi:hypothetical protein